MGQEKEGKSGNLQARRPVDDVRAFLSSYADQFRRVLPRHVTVDRVLTAAMMSVTTTPRLLECSRVSLVRCVMQAAQLGLEVGEHYGHAYLVPFKQQAKLIIGYKGYIELGWRSGKISALDWDTVYEGDLWDYMKGTSKFLKHRRRGECSPEKIIGAWAMLRTTFGGEMFAVIEKGEMEAIKRGMVIRDDSAWDTNEASMWTKTCVRRLYKLAPIGERIATATSIDEQAESGRDQVFHPDLPPVDGEEVA